MEVVFRSDDTDRFKRHRSIKSRGSQRAGLAVLQTWRDAGATEGGGRGRGDGLQGADSKHPRGKFHQP